MMFGAACKGLHCAGCGKGIPAGVVILIVAIAVRGSGLLAHELASALMVICAIVGGCVIATSAVIALMQRHSFQMDYSKWDTPTYVQQKQELEWQDRAQLGDGNPFYQEKEMAP